MSLIKSISGIRGTIGGKIGQNLTPIDAVKFACSYASWLKNKSKKKKLRIVIGRDGRKSGKMIQNLVQNSIISLGIDVIDLGLSTTPTVEIMVKNLQADGGIVITASHNPSDWNALKLLNKKGEFISDDDGKKVIDISLNYQFEFSKINDLGQVIEEPNSMIKHIDSVLKLEVINADAIRKTNLSVVVDGINSSGGIIIPLLLDKLNVKYQKIFCEPNGDFQHDPEPLSKNITELTKKVVQEKADLGIAVDPDVDRLVFVCDNGKVFGEENTLVACADYILSKKLGPTVSNMSSSRALKDITESYGQKFYSSAVGEVNVVREMKLRNAVIGGEGNGGVIYPKNHYGRDAVVGICIFLSLICEKKIKVSDYLETLPKYHMVKDKIKLSNDIDISEILKKLSGEYKNEKQNDIDGLKIDFDEKWIHLRKSNTEPILRVYSEAKSIKDANELVKEMKIKIKSINS